MGMQKGRQRKKYDRSGAADIQLSPPDSSFEKKSMREIENQILEKKSPVILTFPEMKEHWQGHRRLSRRMIERYPDDKLFTHSIGGMRPYSALAMEMIRVAVPGVHGLATGKWQTFEALFPDTKEPNTKQELLQLWDRATEEIEKMWPKIPADRFQQRDVAFDQYDGMVWWHLFYFIDNEIHHRGQGYVYYRSLGLEPPYFWER